MTPHEEACHKLTDVVEFCKENDITLIAAICTQNPIKKERRSYFMNGHESTIRGLATYLEDEIVVETLEEIDDIDDQDETL